MQMKLIVFSIVTVALVHGVCDTEWNSYKQKFKKIYDTSEEDAIHRSIYEENVKEINAHNQRYDAGEVTWKMGINQFTDMTEEESNKWLGILDPIDE